MELRRHRDESLRGPFAFKLEEIELLRKAHLARDTSMEGTGRQPCRNQLLKRSL